MSMLVHRLLVGTALSALAVALPASAHNRPEAEQSTPVGAGVSRTAVQKPGIQSQQSPIATEADTLSSGDIVVTAQKREQAINKIGLSITAQTGDQLLQQNIRSTADLVKVVPGFTFEGAVGQAPIYSIRGVGFHDISLASGQTVAVYTDEVPIPFGYETVGADFDLARVEVLKGPQGTIFGQNSTGGAINYVLAKPTSDMQAGLDVTYGRFNQSDVSAFVSGPLTDTLRARVAIRSIQGSGWQRRYGPVPVGSVRDNSLGKLDQFAGRVILEWRPVDALTATLNVNTRLDRSELTAPQLTKLVPSSAANPLSPEVVAFPLAPANSRAAAWQPGLDFGQDNRWKEATLRLEYDTGPVVLTSISAYQDYRRDAPPREVDGTPYDVLRYGYIGTAKTFYQELRGTGDFGGVGNWILGANYEHDKTLDLFRSINPLATSRILFGLPNLVSESFSRNKISTGGVYGNVEYPVLSNVTLLAGVRYTKADRDAQGCSQDAGNGTLAAIFERIQGNFFAAGVKKTPVQAIPAGGCVTLDANFNPSLFRGSLNEDNISWRGGVNWTVAPNNLIYLNVSRGYKSGSFPIVAATSAVQYTPVPQEELTSYEVGVKSRVTPTLQFTVAGFYYDYVDKQINGTFIDPTFGRLTRLVTIPKSRVLGLEATADWRPFTGLSITPGVSYVRSLIQGTFVNFDPLGQARSFVGEDFPYAPRWQANGAAQYSWPVSDRMNAFVGGNIAYQSSTNGAFGELRDFRLKPYTLVDLRAGVELESGKYRFSVWGTNVFNTYYWNQAGRSFDVEFRQAGMPARYGATFSFRYR